MRRLGFLALILVPLILLGGMTEFPFGGGHIIEDEGDAQPTRPTLNFTGAGVDCADDPGGNETDCVITSGGGSGTVTTVQEGGTPVGGADIVRLNFLAADFDITEPNDTDIRIALAVNAGGVDRIIVDGVDLTDPNFLDTTTIDVTGNVAATPDNITWDVQPNSLDFTELEPALDLDTDTSIAIGDKETLTFTAADSGSGASNETKIQIDFTLDEQGGAADTWTGLLVTATNNRLLADADTNNFVEFRTVATTNNGNYTHILNLNHNENLAGTLLSALRIGGVTSNSMQFGIDLSASTGSLGAINLGLQRLYSSGDLTIGHATDTDSIVFDSDGSGFVRIDGDVITGNLVGNPTGFFTSSTTGPAGAGALRLANVDEIHWEAAPAGTDVQIGVNAGEQFQVTSSVAGIGLVTTTATECKTFSGTEIHCAATLGCDLDASGLAVDGTNFDYLVGAFATSGGDENGSFIFVVPDNIAGTNITAEIWWSSDNAACTNEATTDDVCWTVATASFADDAVWNGGAQGTAKGIVDTCTAQNDIMRAVVTDPIAHGWSVDQLAVVTVTRDVDADHADCADDQYGQDAQLAALKICWEVNNVFSGE